MLDWPFKDECEKFKTIIANSGLADAAENSMLEHDRVAISAFVERLYPETDTFHLSFEEMTITPDDVVQIVRLPVHDKGVRAEFTKQLEWTKLYDLTKKYLGWDEETSTTEFKRCMKYRTRQFNISTLMDMFKGTNEKEEKGTLTDEQVNHAATAYLLCVLGCVIFPNTSGNRAWIYDHFPILKLAIENPAWKKGDPRGTKYVFDENHYRMKEQQLIRLREVLNSLTAQDVCFDPYKEDRADGHIAGRSDLCPYFGPLWQPTGYVMYNSSRVMRQHGFVQGIPKGGNPWKFLFDPGGVHV
ncbi:uncharacterized protein LOC113336074 [Papaver somniferum]|uniref:uncharacterized protein LOC113336074 n=1 Tax=Papaver somniferum TaxID=3469 RepID=UPI000E6F49D4|nr:uncharacterized protein LOC113336074 [Papaver somniferum]